VIEEWLNELPVPPPAGWTRAVTPRAAGKYTSTSAHRVLKAVEAGELPALRHDGEVRFRVADLRAWAQTVPVGSKPKAEPPREPKPPAVPIPEDAELVTVREAAAVLGVSIAYIYQLVRAGKLPSVRRGWRVLIPKAAVEARRLTHQGTRPGGSRTGPRL
jgi:excisionase family DNA binding protein